jgi:large conductance mechanosensitive channel
VKNVKHCGIEQTKFSDKKPLTKGRIRGIMIKNKGSTAMAKESKIKKFFEEFKKFITRGNVLDMAVGIIVGGAFTAIVNGLSNNVLKPLINWMLAVILGDEGKEGLEGAITMLHPAYFADQPGVVDLANSIYIDWGAFISSIINFLLIAFALFTIVKIINRISERADQIFNNPEWSKKRAIAHIRYEEHVSKKEAKALWLRRHAELLAKVAEEKRLAEEKATKEKAEMEARAMANTRLLEEIRDLLKQRYTND